MAANPKTPTQDRPPKLSLFATLVRLGVIGVVMLVVVGAFAYTGGWLTPGRLTPVRIINEFERQNGVHAGFRRNHAKGVCFAGVFESNGQGIRFSKASVFDIGQVPIIGRFALAGGQPDMPDTPQTVRSMALRFTLPGDEEWRTGMNDIPVFPFNTVEAFYEQLTLSQPDPATGKPDPAPMAAFMARHPETVRALDLIKNRPVSSGFDNDTFNSLNAFRFVDMDGHSVPVRWSMVPGQPFAAPGAEASTEDKNYLFDDVIARIEQQPLQYHLIVTIGHQSDLTNDATIAWPEDRERVDLGTLVIDHVEGEISGPCRDVNFDPLILPSGIEPSDDPLLSARSAAYSQSFRRREGEAKEPSAVTTPEADKGAS